MLFTPSSASREWVTVNGETRPETPSQHALVEKPMFQMGLSLYRYAKSKNMMTAESRRIDLNQSMQEAYNRDMPTANHHTPQG